MTVSSTGMRDRESVTCACRPGHDVWAIDLEPDMVAVVRQNALDRGIGRIHWFVGRVDGATDEGTVMLTELLAEIERQGGYDGAGPETVVDLETFFEGNDDFASIGCNLLAHPSPVQFYAVLRSVRDRPEVHGVWVGISEVMGLDEWPFSDHVYVEQPRTPLDAQPVPKRPTLGQFPRRLHHSVPLVYRRVVGAPQVVPNIVQAHDHPSSVQPT